VDDFYCDFYLKKNSITMLIPRSPVANNSDRQPRRRNVLQCRWVGDRRYFKPKVLARKPIIERVSKKIIDFIDTFIEGMGGTV
jgi:hypothetical protein